MEEIKDINNVIIDQQEIDFSQENNVLYVNKEQIKVFIGNVDFDNEDNIPGRSIEDFKDELLNSRMISVYKAEKDEKEGGIRFFGITEHYFYHFKLVKYVGDEVKNNIAILDVITGKSQIAAANTANRSKRLKIKAPTYGLGVALERTKELYHTTKYNDNWAMSDSLFEGFVSKLNKFFEQDIQKNDDIPGEFRDNIINTIYQVNEVEKKIEQDKASGGASLSYAKVVLDSDASPEDKKDNDITYLTFELNETSETFNSAHASTYPEGTNVEIPTSSAKLIGRIEAIDDTDEYVKLTIGIRQQFSLNDLLKEGEIKLKPNLTQYKVRRDVINKLRNRSVESTYMYDVFSNFETQDLNEETDEIKQFIDDPEIMRPDSPAAQKNAVSVGLRSNDVELVLGPPGTGKTTVIVTWIKYLVKHKQRVLVSSKNNAAVDNVLERLPKEFIDEDGNKQDLSIIRIGSNENKIAPSCRDFLAKNRLADSKKHIMQSTEEALSLLNTCKIDIPSIINKIDSDVVLRQEVDSLNKQITQISQDNEYVNAIKTKETLEAKLEKVDISKKYLDEYTQYTNEYKQLGIFGKLKEGLLGLIINLRRNKYQRQYNKSLKEKEKVKNNIKVQEQIIDSFINKINPIKERIDDILNNQLQFNKEDLKNLSDINIKIARFDDFEELTIENLNEIKKLISEMNFDSLISIVEDWQKEINTTGNRMLTDILAEDSNVVGATCIGINSNKQFANLNFDITILDESGQIQIQDAIVPLTRSRKNILLGDHNQIPPQANDTIVEQCKGNVNEPSLLKDSFFEYLYNNMKGSNNVVDLDSQFRMPETLANLVGWKFYNNNYKSPLAASDDKRGVVIPNTSKPLIIIDTSANENRYESVVGEGDHKTYCNNYEAKVIGKLMSRVFSNPDCLIKNKDTDKEEVIKPYDLVGIIAPYSKQIQTIRDAIKKEKIECGQTKISSYVNNMVATLDSFQGQERPLIVFDFTRSSKTSSDKSRVGFLRELRRLNVAFTRSTKQLVIIGDIKYLTECEFVDEKNGGRYNSEKEFSDFIKRVVEDAKKNGEIYSSEEILNG